MWEVSGYTYYSCLHSDSNVEARPSSYSSIISFYAEFPTIIYVYALDLWINNNHSRIVDLVVVVYSIVTYWCLHIEWIKSLSRLYSLPPKVLFWRKKIFKNSNFPSKLSFQNSRNLSACRNVEFVTLLLSSSNRRFFFSSSFSKNVKISEFTRPQELSEKQVTTRSSLRVSSTFPLSTTPTRMTC